MKKITILLMLLVVATSTQAQNIFSKNPTLQVQDMTFVCSNLNEETVSVNDKNIGNGYETKYGDPSQRDNSMELRQESYDNIVNISRSVFSKERIKTLVKNVELKSSFLRSTIRIYFIVNGNGDVQEISYFFNKDLMLSKEEIYKLHTQFMQTKILHKGDFTGSVSLVSTVYFKLNTLYK